MTAADLLALARDCPIDLGGSSELVITQETVDAHAATTGDEQWIHNDPERAARESPFGGPIVQGFLLLASLTRLSGELSFPSAGGVSMLVNYGFDRVRFLEPVPVGAAIRLHGTLAEVRPRTGDGAGAVLAVDVELLHRDVTALAARWLFLAVPA